MKTRRSSRESRLVFWTTATIVALGVGVVTAQTADPETVVGTNDPNSNNDGSSFGPYGSSTLPTPAYGPVNPNDNGDSTQEQETPLPLPQPLPEDTGEEDAGVGDDDDEEGSSSSSSSDDGQADSSGSSDSSDDDETADHTTHTIFGTWYHYGKREAANPLVVHVTCMLLAWGLLLPSGILSAHFLRRRSTWTTEAWFKWHLGLNALGLAFALVGWSVALTQFDIFRDNHKGTLLYQHAVLGCFTMGLALLQPVTALLRPSNHPTEVFRKTWKWIHQMGGWVAFLCSMVTILLGMQVVTFSATVQKVYLIMLAFLSLLALCLGYGNLRLEQQEGGKADEEKMDHSLPQVELKPMIVYNVS